MSVFYSGLDLGKRSNFSAFAADEVERTIPDRENPKTPALRHNCRWLQRWPLGTPYPEICAAVGRMYARPPLAGSMLLVDSTGVGIGVVDMLKDYCWRNKVEVHIRPVTITGGSSVTPASDGIHVAKKQLASALQSALQGRRVRIADQLPEADVLRRELEAFQLKVTESANEVFGAEAGQYDDLVLALMMPVFLGERRGLGFEAPNIPEVDRARLPAVLRATTVGEPRPIDGPNSVSGGYYHSNAARRGLFGRGGGPAMGNWQRRGLWGWGT
jgi:hypothetical protein